MNFNNHILLMNGRDQKILLGKLKLKVGASFILFCVITLIIVFVSWLMLAFGNPTPGIIKRAGLAIFIIFILITIIFRKTFLIAIDLILSKKVKVCYDGVSHGIDIPEFINRTVLLAKLSESEDFEKIDFNHSFKIELSKIKKEILYIEQFGKVIFPKQD